MTTNNNNNADVRFYDVDYNPGAIYVEWGKKVARKYVRKFSQQIGIGHQTPRLILNQAEAKRIKRKNEPIVDWYDGCFGAYIPYSNSIYINLPLLAEVVGTTWKDFCTQLIVTVAHELTHARFRDEFGHEHGPAFEERENEILQGKKFPETFLYVMEGEDLEELKRDEMTKWYHEHLERTGGRAPSLSEEIAWEQRWKRGLGNRRRAHNTPRKTLL
jgi:hypothetical protein